MGMTSGPTYGGGDAGKRNGEPVGLGSGRASLDPEKGKEKKRSNVGKMMSHSFNKHSECLHGINTETQGECCKPSRSRASFGMVQDQSKFNLILGSKAGEMT